MNLRYLNDNVGFNCCFSAFTLFVALSSPRLSPFICHTEIKAYPVLCFRSVNIHVKYYLWFLNKARTRLLSFIIRWTLSFPLVKFTGVILAQCGYAPNIRAAHHNHFICRE